MKLSVIVPVYNVEPYLEACLNSLLQQQEVDEEYEIVCVNDGSTDGSGEILARYAGEHSRIHLITRKNGGLSAARNTGICSAMGEYIWFVDADDMVNSYAVGQLCRAVAANQWPDKILFNYQEFSDGHPETPDIGQKPIGQIIPFSSGTEMDADKRIPSWNTAWNFIIKHEVLQENRLLFVEGILFEDEEFNFWLSRYTGHCIYINSVFYYYRKRAGSILNTFMSSRFDQYINGRIHLATVHRAMLSSYDEPSSERMRSVVSRQELEASVLYDIQGVLSRLLARGHADYFETYLSRLKQEEFYPYPIPWKNLIPRKSVSKTLINWAALGFPWEKLLRVYMTVLRKLKKGGSHD